MRFDLDQLDPAVTYKLLAATVVPRPIAWITTRDKEKRVNAAPYSFFNAMGAAPPTVAVGIQADPKRGFKDTARAILETGEFVVNLVPAELAEAMNITAVDAPTGVNELDLAGLTQIASEFISPPRIAESPVSMECVNLSSLVTGPNQTIVIGRVLAIHIADNMVLDAERGHVDTPALDLVARTFGSGYVYSRDRFEMERPVWKK